MLNKLSSSNYKPGGPGSKCKIHKYRRFSKRNKTYRTDIYYCSRCPHYINLDQIFGRDMECWRCGIAFTFRPNKNNTQPLKPECGCKNRTSDEVREIASKDKSLDWLEEEGGKESLVDSIMADLEKISKG